MKRRSFLVPAAAVLLPLVVGAAIDRDRPAIGPTVPGADRTDGDRVFLERADRLYQNAGDTFSIVVGDVVFTKGPMTMRCDSAHYTPGSESFDAFGHVSMEQGDTLRVDADELNYDGLRELAVLYADPGKKVVMRNRDVTLETDVFYYDLAIELGYYRTGGVLSDPNNTLTSLEGEYAPPTKEALFYRDVHLYSRNQTDTLNIYSDTLYYNTETHIAELFSPSRVVNFRGTIYTTNGIYDTDSDRITLYDRSTIVTTQGQTITADTLYYDRRAAFGEAFGALVLTDSAHSAEARGDYGYYDEAADSSFITGRAMLAEYSEGDTLFLHGRYIQSFRRIDTVHIAADTVAGTEASQRLDTTHVAVVFPRVRFYRSDLQGVCDSLRFTEADTTLTMFRNPVVWNEDRQVAGNIIELHLNDSTIERAVLPEQGFTAQHIEGEHYNQLSGKKMTAYFEGGEMRRLTIDGNVEIIMYPEENDSTINKMVSAESSFLEAFFRGRTAERVKMWPQTTGTATPLFLARPSIYYLPKFKWFGDVRPADANDIFVISEAMEQLMAEWPPTVIEYTPRSPLVERRPLPAAAAPPSDGDTSSVIPPSGDAIAGPETQ